MEKQKSKTNSFNFVYYAIFIMFVIIICLIIYSFVINLKCKKIKIKVIKQSEVITKLNNENQRLKEKLNRCQNSKFTKETEKKLVAWILRYDKAYPKLAYNIVSYLKEKSPHPLLTLAIIATESSFITQSTSRTGAIGLMQVQPQYWLKELKEKGIVDNKKELYDPIKNIMAGEYIINKYLDECGSLEGAISKYFTGKCKSKKSSRYKLKVLKTLGELYLVVSD